MGRAGEVAAAPSTPRQEPFEVLSGCGHHSLAIHLRQPTQSEPSQAMPLLALTKQRLDPHLSLLLRLFVGGGLVIRRHTIQILLKKAAADGAPILAAGTFRLQGTGSAACRIGVVVMRLSDVVVVSQAQDRASRAGVVVGLGILATGLAAKQGPALVPIGYWHIGTNVGIGERTNNLDCAIGCVTGRTTLFVAASGNRAARAYPGTAGSPSHQRR